MTAPELADALDAAVAHISSTVDETHPMAGVYVIVRHDVLRLAAQRLRELEAVRVAAANMDRAWHRAENGDRTAREFAAADALRAALGRVGGG